MGHSQSKGPHGSSQRVTGRGFRPSLGRLAAIQDTEPRIVLANQSSFRVSYWVLEEYQKHKRTKADRERLVGSMILYLNGGNQDDSKPPVETANGPEEENVDREDEGTGCYFLTRDHRMEPMGGTQGTKVAFPVDCQEMSVCAFFEGGGCRWRLFQDRVYSIGLLRKVFTFTALDRHIKPFNIGTDNR